MWSGRLNFHTKFLKRSLSYSNYTDLQVLFETNAGSPGLTSSLSPPPVWEVAVIISGISQLYKWYQIAQSFS